MMVTLHKFSSHDISSSTTSTLRLQGNGLCFQTNQSLNGFENGSRGILCHRRSVEQGF